MQRYLRKYPAKGRRTSLWRVAIGSAKRELLHTRLLGWVRMDWKLFASTFAAIFVAELGDKTQLAALSFSAGSSSKWTVFLASALALTLSSAIAVGAGEAVSRFVSPIWLRRAAGAIFVVMGVLFLVRKP